MGLSAKKMCMSKVIYNKFLSISSVHYGACLQIMQSQHQLGGGEHMKECVHVHALTNTHTQRSILTFYNFLVFQCILRHFYYHMAFKGQKVCVRVMANLHTKAASPGLIAGSTLSRP